MRAAQTSQRRPCSIASCQTSPGTRRQGPRAVNTSVTAASRSHPRRCQPLLGGSGAAQHPTAAGSLRLHSVRRFALKASALKELEQVKDEGEQGTSAQYEAAILEVSNAEQWMICLELLTEVRLLRLSLADYVMERAVLTLAEVRQGKKAADILAAQIKSGAAVSPSTVTTIMQALAREIEYKAAESLIAIASDGITEDMAPAYNCLARTYARADQVESARTVFNDLFSKHLVEGNTYTSLASMYLRSGEGDEADNMLELRG